MRVHKVEKKSVKNTVQKKTGSPANLLTDNRPQTQQFKQLQQLAHSSSSSNNKSLTQLQSVIKESSAPVSVPAQQPVLQQKANNTGLPDNLKAGVENLSGYSMDDVKVHYNSAKPAQLQALAYAQGTDIHLAPGQEKHLPHEAWHVVQQKQGRVKPTVQMKGSVNVNDDKGLEREADVMGSKIFLPPPKKFSKYAMNKTISKSLQIQTVQRKVYLNWKGRPALKSIVEIASITRPNTPNVLKIPGVKLNVVKPPYKKGKSQVQVKNPDYLSARHIIAFAAQDREFKARYSGRTVKYLRTIFPSIKIDDDYLTSLSKHLQIVFSYENQQLNRGFDKAAEPEGAESNKDRNKLESVDIDPNNAYVKSNKMKIEDGSNPNMHRNYWKGSQEENLETDKDAEKKFSQARDSMDKELRIDQYAYMKTVKAKPNQKERKAKRTSKISADRHKQVIEALSSEFDPPPFTTRAVLDSHAAEFARLTNSWIENDKYAKHYYGLRRKGAPVGKKGTFTEANVTKTVNRPFKGKDFFKYGKNKEIYDNAK